MKKIIMVTGNVGKYRVANDIFKEKRIKFNTRKNRNT